LEERADAYQLLKDLGASDRLIAHAQLVGEAADRLLLEYQSIGMACDSKLVELGAVLHDAGKIHHPQELAQGGSEHELAGRELLLSHGVQTEVAQCCYSHGSWNLPDVSFEERTVALADKLWKGKRESLLELSIIDAIAEKLGVSRWDIFERLDTAFEEIAAGGDDRLQRSRMK
jgi:putative nucleotidyltransferase with HDIG domain